MLLIAFLWIGFERVQGSRLEIIQISDSLQFSLSKREKENLDFLFKNLIAHNCAGYALLGTKPLFYDAFLQPRLKESFFFLLEAFSPSNLKKYKAWKTWEKYHHLFQEKNILIWKEPSPWRKGVEFIVIANRASFCRVVDEHIDDFRIILDRGNLVAEDLLKDTKQKSLFKEVLKSNEGLMGALLGYGWRNAFLFSNHPKQKGSSFSGAFKEENNFLLQNTKTALNFAFGWPRVELSEALLYPCFWADLESEETKILKKQYLETREKILKYYEGKDFLTATLQLLEN